RCAERVLLLFGVERLAPQIQGGLGGSDAGAILLHAELRVAHLDAHLVLNLLDAQLGLPVLKFRAYLRGLGGTIAERYVDRDARALVGSGRIDQFIQSAAIGGIWEWREPLAKLLGRVRLRADVLGIRGTAQAVATVVCEQVHGGQQSAPDRFIADLGIGKVDTRFRQFGTMPERIIHKVLGRDNRFLRRQFHGRGRNYFAARQYRA